MKSSKASKSQPASRSKSAPTSRERLLEAASRRFSQSGYAGASVDGIVGDAGVNKRMVYHYFGSKKGLYRAVWERAFRELVEAEQGWLGDSEDFWELSEKMVCGSFSFLFKHPEFSRLLLWENLNGGKNLDNLEISGERTENLRKFARAMRQESQKHPWLKSWKPGEWMIHLIGLCQIYFSNQHTLAISFGLDYRSEEALQRAERQVLRLLQQIRATGLVIE